MKNSFLITLLLVLFSVSLFGQQNGELKIKSQDSIATKKLHIDPLSPAKAAFYSAVLPGLGQAFNKQYWKIPVIYAGLGAGITIYSWQNTQYNRYRDAYKRRILGFTDDEFPTLTDATIIDAQRYHKKNRDLTLLVTALFYILNIVEANVSAHLAQFNVSEDLTFNPSFYQDEFSYKPKVGLTLNYKF
ncbi:MAG: hypothetical protein HRT69_01905 [Flavobacteriaceae bacterium]|nr:hypothetical protein [Flavobacteriaceae bacterium]